MIAPATTSSSPSRRAWWTAPTARSSRARRRGGGLPPGPGLQRRGGARPGPGLLRRDPQPQGQAAHRPARSCAARTGSGSTPSRSAHAVLRHMLEHLLARPRRPVRGRRPRRARSCRWSARARDALLDAAPPAGRALLRRRASTGIYVRTDLGVDVLCADRAATSCARRSASRRSPRRRPSACASSPGGRASASTWTPTRSRRRRASTSAPSSFTKGCYVGQETVARLHYRGKPNRHLRGLRLSRAGRARRRDPARRARWSGGSARPASRRGSARSRSRWSGARRARATRCWWTAPPAAGRRAALRRVAEPRRTPRAATGCRGDSPLLGGTAREAAPRSCARQPGYDARAARSTCRAERRRADLRELRELDPAAEPGRELDDWGRSQRVFDLRRAAARLLLPLLVPGRGRGRRERARRRRRADRVQPLRRAAAGRPDDHAGDPPRAPAARARCYMLGEHWFKGYPGRRACSPTRSGWWPRTRPTPSGCCATRGGSCSSSPRARRASRKLYWQRYRLRRFGRGGFVRTAMRAGVPIVPVAVVGAEEAMPIFAHVPLLQRLTGLIYFPVNHAFPQFGLAAGADVPAREVQDPLPRARRPVALRPRGRRRRGARPGDRRARSARRIQEELDDAA